MKLVFYLNFRVSELYSFLNELILCVFISVCIDIFHFACDACNASFLFVHSQTCCNDLASRESAIGDAYTANGGIDSFQEQV